MAEVVEIARAQEKPEIRLITKKTCLACEFNVLCVVYDVFVSHPTMVSCLWRNGCPGELFRKATH
jgi:hypothetical protein